MRILRYSIFILSLCFHTLTWTQIQSSVSFDKDTIEIGESATLRVRLGGGEINSLKSINFSNLDSIKILEVVDQEGNYEERLADVNIEAQEADYSVTGRALDRLLSKRDTSISIRFWDVGYHFIPNLYYSLEDDSLRQNKGGASILVLPPGKILNSKGDSISLAPIRSIIEEPVHWTDYKYYIFAGLGLLLLTVIVYFIKTLRRRKKQEIEEIKIVRPAHEIALDKLHLLDEKKIWQKGEIKLFQSELTYIIREYLENRYNFPALESTTDIILKDLQDFDISQEQSRSLKEILQIADLVKFAKAKPELDIHQRFLNEARQFVQSTKSIAVESIEEND